MKHKFNGYVIKLREILLSTNRLHAVKPKGIHFLVKLKNIISMNNFYFSYKIYFNLFDENFKVCMINIINKLLHSSVIFLPYSVHRIVCSISPVAHVEYPDIIKFKCMYYQIYSEKLSVYLSAVNKYKSATLIVFCEIVTFYTLKRRKELKIQSKYFFFFLKL